MNAAFGGVSGSVAVVTHGNAGGIGDTPGVANGVGVTSVLTQPAGRAGGVTPSKFSAKPGGHVGDGEGDAGGVGVGDAGGVGVGDTAGVGVVVAGGVGVGVAAQGGGGSI